MFAVYGKRYPPSFCDKVWRLKKIDKKGVYCERLSREGIYTVKDFLELLFTNPERLQEVNLLFPFLLLQHLLLHIVCRLELNTLNSRY